MSTGCWACFLVTHPAAISDLCSMLSESSFFLHLYNVIPYLDFFLQFINDYRSYILFKEPCHKVMILLYASGSLSKVCLLPFIVLLGVDFYMWCEVGIKFYLFYTEMTSPSTEMACLCCIVLDCLGYY